jgi:hypothetical protein
VTAPGRRHRALLAAGLSAFGLCVGPALHGELHARERESALERLFQLAFRSDRGPGYSQELARAAEEALGGGRSHRHGPPGGAEHGAGSLAHLALAVHPAAPPPPLPAPASVPELIEAGYSPAHLSPRYLVPDRSQGPPRG